MKIETVGVVGAGTMGNGIAQAFAQAGVEVALTDVAQAQLDRAMKTVAVRSAMPVSPMIRHQPRERSLVAGSLTVE